MKIEKTPDADVDPPSAALIWPSQMLNKKNKNRQTQILADEFGLFSHQKWKIEFMSSDRINQNVEKRSITKWRGVLFLIDQVLNYWKCWHFFKRLNDFHLRVFKKCQIEKIEKMTEWLTINQIMKWNQTKHVYGKNNVSEDEMKTKMKIPSCECRNPPCCVDLTEPNA